MDNLHQLFDTYQSKCMVCVERKSYCPECIVRAAKKALKNAIPERTVDGETCPHCNTYNPTWLQLTNPQAHKIVYCWNCGQAVDRSRFAEMEKEEQRWKNL